jgi:multicomponent Na+:H+ antiporter subunit D
VIPTWADALPWLVTIPLVGAALAPVVGVRHGHVAGWWALAVLAATAFVAAGLTAHVAESGPFSYTLGGWVAPYGIELRFDRFAAWTLAVSALFVLVLPFSMRYLATVLPRERLSTCYGLLLLNCGGMLVFTVSGDLFTLFVAMELVSVSSYALVAVTGRGVAAWAALKYLLIGSVSSILVLFGVTMLFAVTGSLNIADVSARLATAAADGPITLALACLTVAFLVKAALFPLHVWLPDAHAIAPSPVSAVLSGMVVKIGIIGILRVYELAAGAGLEILALNEVLVWLGAIAIVAGAFLALFQDDVKLMLAYSTVSNIGYIVLGLGLASPYAIIGGAVHVLNHALIKVTLFLAIGAIIHQTGLRTLSDLRGVARSMPQTAAAVAIGAVSIVGLPPTAGFVCKWYIALGAFEAGRGGFGFALVFGALFIFVYYVRLLNVFYFRPATRPEVTAAREADGWMRAPVLILAALCLILGILGGVPLAFVEPSVAELLVAWGR